MAIEDRVGEFALRGDSQHLKFAIGEGAFYHHRLALEPL
jgi:hypothetical protein